MKCNKQFQLLFLLLWVISACSNISLITTIHQISTDGFKPSVHLSEVLLSLGENCRSDQISNIHVLIDTGVDNEDVTKKLRKAVLQAQLSSLVAVGTIRGYNVSAHEIKSEISSLNKLVAIVFGKQPTYAEMFKYADSKLSHSMVAILNADIVLHGLHRLDYEAFDSLIAHTIAVSTSKEGCGEDECSKPQGWSWDVHIFKSPLAPSVNYSLLEVTEPTPVYMNAMGAENRVGYMLKMGGYSLSNPCRDIVAEHWHCGAKEHFGRKRVDSKIEDPLIEKGIFSDVIRWGIKPKATTKFFWVPRCDGGVGIKHY